jgi:undecaprenyl-diphosphatase
MDAFQVILLSIVEGLTEFLPISSTGHLILTSKALGLEVTEFLKTFEIAIQLGAIMAIVVLYFKRLTNIALIKKLIVAFIPTALVGFLLYPIIKGYLLGSSVITLIMLFLGGLVLIFFKGRKSGFKEIDFKRAFLIGVFQALSVVPGVSRAAATIVGGLALGVDRKAATEFSFLLAVPTMFAATGFDLYKSAGLFQSQDIKLLIIGFALSFIFAAISVKFLVKYVQTHDFKIFGIYRIVLALVFWLFVL